MTTTTNMSRKPSTTAILALALSLACTAVITCTTPAHADMVGTVWGVLASAPSCTSANETCVLTLSTSTVTLTAYCVGGAEYLACAALTSGTNISMAVYAKPLPACGGVPQTILVAAASPDIVGAAPQSTSCDFDYLCGQPVPASGCGCGPVLAPSLSGRCLSTAKDAKSLVGCRTVTGGAGYYEP